MNLRAGLLGCLAAVVTASCGESASPAAPTQASLTVTIRPNQIPARRCNPLCVAPSGKSFPFEAAMIVRVQESARVGGDVNFINVTPVTAAGVELPMLSYGSDVIVQRATTNHIVPAGLLDFALAFFYATGENNAALTVKVSLQFTDEKGNVLTGTAEATVTDPG